MHVKIFLVRIELKSGSSNYGGVIQTSNGKEIKFTSTSLADKKALQVGDNVCYQHGIHQTTGLVRAVNVQERSKPFETRMIVSTMAHCQWVLKWVFTE